MTDIEQAAHDFVAAYHYRLYCLVCRRSAKNAEKAIREGSERLERLAMDFLNGDTLNREATRIESLAVAYVAAAIHATVAEKINAPYASAAADNQMMAFQSLTAEIVNPKEDTP